MADATSRSRRTGGSPGTSTRLVVGAVATRSRARSHSRAASNSPSVIRVARVSPERAEASAGEADEAISRSSATAPAKAAHQQLARRDSPASRGDADTRSLSFDSRSAWVTAKAAISRGGTMTPRSARPPPAGSAT